MKFIYTQHALDRMNERGTDKNEVEITIRNGQRRPGHFNRIKFVRIFNFNQSRHGVNYKVKQLEVSAEAIGNDWKIITVIVKYY